MKIGPLDGTPEEIRDFCENHGFAIEKYFVPEQPIGLAMFAIPGGVYVAVLGVLALAVLPQRWALLSFLIGATCSVWLAVSLQLKFKNAWATGIALLGAVALLLVATGVLAPQELLDEARRLRDSQ